MLSRFVCTLACGAAVCLSSTVAAQPTLLHDVEVVWDSQLVREAPGHIAVRLRGASTLTESEPIAGHVTLTLVRPDDVAPKSWTLFDGDVEASASELGTPITFRTPTLQPGSYVLRLETSSAHGAKMLERRVGLVDPTTLLLRTDRGVYKPGQTVRWRAILLNAANNHPLHDADVTVVISDPRGTQVWRDTVKTSRGGMVAGVLPLAEELITGQYTLKARHSGANVSSTIEVRPFELPPFDVQIHLDEARLKRGEPVQAEIVVRHHYGEPVAGKVHVEMRGASPYNSRGVLDDDGTFAVDVVRDTSDTAFSITATAIDGADRSQSARTKFSWPAPRVTIDIIPEQGTAAVGRRHAFTIITAGADGQPTPALLHLDVEGGAKLTRESEGVTRVEMAMPDRRRRIDVKTSTQVDSYSYTFNGDDKDANRALERVVAVNRFALERCIVGNRNANVMEDRLAIIARLKRRRWTLTQVGRHPFPDRPEFLTPAAASEKVCLERALKKGLNYATRRISRKMTGELSFDIRVKTETSEVDVKRRYASLTVKAVTADGLEAERRETVELWRRESDDGARPIDVTHVVVDSGETINVRAPWAQGKVTATLLSHDTALASVACKRDASGRHVVAKIPVPLGVSGLLDVRLTSTAWAAPNPKPSLHYASASVYVRPRRLNVVMDAPERSRPGTATALAISVSDANGSPIRAASVAASVVDERVLALSKPLTTLSSVLNPGTIDEAGESGKVFAALLRNPRPSQIQHAFMRAVIEKMGAKAPRPDVVMTAVPRYVAEVKATRAQHRVIIDGLGRTSGGVIKDGAMAIALAAVLASKKVGIEDRQSPWSVDRTWSYVAAVQPQWTPEYWGREVTQWRLYELTQALTARKQLAIRALRRKKRSLAAVKGIEAFLLTDAWGNPIRVDAGTRRVGLDLRSAGLDGRFETSDDLVRSDVFGEIIYTGRGAGGMGMMGTGAGGGGHALGRSSSMRVMMKSGGRGEAQVALRTRFDETVLWSIGEETDANGQLHLPFHLADSVTGFQVDIEAIGPDGGLGYHRGHVETYLESYVDSELPAALTVGDRYAARAVVTHHGAQERMFEVQSEARGAVAVREAGPWLVKVKGSAAIEVPLEALKTGEGVVQVRLVDIESGRTVDAMERTITVQAKGMAQHRIYTGVVEGGHGDMPVTLPDDVEPSTLSGTLRVFRGAADQALDGLEAMLREPHGCFEQTSSTTFPNLLVLQLLEGKPGQEKHIARARTLVGKGYQRLLTYEVSGGGFSWFGSAPASKVLTAYGLLEFVEMARVYPVDGALIARTRRWLVAQQKSNGGWASDAKWASSQTSSAVTAYIAWGLAESGGAEPAVRRALRHLARDAGIRKDPYALALWVAAARRIGADTQKPMAALAKFMRTGDGGRYVEAKGRNLFFEGGTTGSIEATAIMGGALAGEMEAGPWLDWLWSKRNARYGWGTTQATVQALRAAALADRQAGAVEGTLVATLGDRTLGSLDLAATQIPTVSLPPKLSPGEHTISLRGAVEGRVRTDLRVQWRGIEPPIAESRGLAVHMVLAAAKATVGEPTVVKIGLMNPGTEVVAMPTLVIPIPAGVKADPASLKRLVATTEVTRFDDRGDAINLYLERLAPGQTFLAEITLIPTTVCDVMQHPVQAYAYYDPEVRGWSAAGRWRVARANRASGSDDL